MGNFFTALTAETLWKYTHMNIPFNELDKAITYLKNIVVSCDGALSWDSSTGTLSWASTIRIHFNTAAGNLVQNTIATGSIAMTDGQFAYVDLNETNGTALTVSAGNISTGAASNILAYNRLVLGYRNAASDDFYPVYLKPPMKPETKDFFIPIVEDGVACTQWAAGAMNGVLPSSWTGLNLKEVIAGTGSQVGVGSTMSIGLYRLRVSSIGDSTTRFDITRPGTPDANTTRYTWDGTGTDPVITNTLASLQPYDTAYIQAQNFSVGNNGQKMITAVGDNWFETIDSGSLEENDKTIGTGSIRIGKGRPMLSTEVTIDSDEFSSLTAATPAVINTDYDDLQAGDLLYAMISAVHTTPAEGCYLTGTCRLP
ncbi:MAG: hypothetical protein HPY65_13870 [Syntrophaceae bacterium]|nr:hypothetical protein [Syntrophaceae bacterium]